MGFFAGLDTEGYDRQYSDRQLVTRMGQYFKPHFTPLIISIGLLLIISITGAVTPLIVSRGVDMISNNPPAYTIGLLFLAILGIGVTNWGVNWLRRRISVRIIGAVELRLRTDAFTAAAEHDLSFYDEFSSGRIVSRITSDTKDFGQVVMLISDVASQIVQAVILGVILIRIEWRLSLYLFAFLPILFIIAISFRGL